VGVKNNMALDIGRIAFEAYAESVGGKTYDGKDIPKWESVGKTVQDGWRHAAVAVSQYLNKCKSDMDDGIIG